MCFEYFLLDTHAFVLCYNIQAHGLTQDELKKRKIVNIDIASKEYLEKSVSLFELRKKLAFLERIRQK